MKSFATTVALSFALLVATACVTHRAAEKPFEFKEKRMTKEFRRGMWVRATATASPDSVSRIVHIAAKLHVTDIFVQVVVGGYAYYNSELLPRSQYLSKISDPDYDPLDSLIRAFAHTPVRIHAWVNTLLYWSLADPPDSSNHVFYTHPDWFMDDINNRSMIDYSYDQWKNLRIEGLYLDPENPEVVAFVQDICAEIVSRYPVDGVHLDFIRYPGVLWGLPHNDESAVLAGMDIDKIRYCSTIRYGRLSFYERWQTWHVWRLTRNRQWIIASMVSGISSRMKQTAIKHDCQLSAAVFANPSLGRYSFAQNWTEWASYMDLPVVMSYTPDIALFNQYVDFATRNRPDAVMGIGLLWPDMHQTARLQEYAAQNAHAAGVCYFDFTVIDTMTNFPFAGYDTLEQKPLNADSTPFEPVSDAFTDRPRSDHTIKGMPVTAWGSDIDFAAFLLSLSLDPNCDLARMKLSREDFLHLISQDVAAFLYLDREIFPLGDTLIEPPQRSVRFTFIPWLDEDSLAVFEKATATTEFAQHSKLYPTLTDPLAKVVFMAKPGNREVFSTPAGVYVFITDTLFEGGRRIPRKDLPPETFPICANWTIRNKFMSKMDEGK
jgi:uncharacterized lipoprotein YddW (UPF0748 family)